MTAIPASYSLLRRLTLAFAAVAALVFALTGAYLYRSLSELRRLASYLQALADEAGVRIDVHGEAPVVADATLFRRAVSNLASNALEHAEAASTIELAVSTQGGYAVVEVTNRGAAIPPEQVDRIFERFYRIDSSRHGAERNAGLGLAIVKSIMELHRGKVEVASRDGRTTFALYFPRGTNS